MRIKQLFQYYEDKLLPYRKTRWCFLSLSLILFNYRVISLQGFYVVSYALWIFLLSLFLKFLTPLKGDVEDEDCDHPVLPIREVGEFKPFIRKLSEYKFWKAAQIGISIGILCTLTQRTNIPVYWPILVFYFFVLLGLTMRKQIAHMIKHGYIPLSIGKTTY